MRILIAGRQRRDWTAPGSAPESETARCLRAFAVARLGAVEGHGRGAGRRRRARRRGGKRRRRADPPGRRDQRAHLAAPALTRRRHGGGGGTRSKGPGGRQHQPARGASRRRRAPLPAAERRVLLRARRGPRGRIHTLHLRRVTRGRRRRARLHGAGIACIGGAGIRVSSPCADGFFYGPGTWFAREGDIGDQVRRQEVPIIGGGQGVYSFVHVDDAAEATVAALEGPPGAYNIVDGDPSPQARVAHGVCARRGRAAAAACRRRRGAADVGAGRGLLRDEAQGRFEREGRARARVPPAAAGVDRTIGPTAMGRRLASPRDGVRSGGRSAGPATHRNKAPRRARA